MTIDKPTPFVIPTVDLAPYLEDPSSAASANIIEQVRQACITSGFFQIENHGISRDLQQSVLNAAEAFFALPLEAKKQVVHPTLKNRGYELIGSQALQEGALPDLKEGFYVGQHIPNTDERVKDHPHLMGPNIFPPNIPEDVLKNPTETYYRDLLSLSGKIMEILAKGLPYGNEVFVPFMSNDPVCSIRLLHYPPQKTKDVRQLGAGAHTDFGAITLLMQDMSGGLEVLNDTTGQWIPVDPNPDAYVVNIGDMLSMWTKNKYKSATHRVINTSNKDRYSVPFFVDGNTDVKLTPFDGSEPVGGKVLTAEEHMLERFGTTYGRAEKLVAASSGS
ncbi:2og-Fe oxygenase family protein [Pseudomassariella vexata]|uniref:2og-Fe oxygenase family protein n=1 Tax=Pseudomassariella vexata TaxID=1141098 RepID=A0A1Y2DTL6_9PEZI|nr:2og-Fe oxygenase family protein [Pseudomassariella vexata]ORY62623.1 2og-Fe oxygenase family protein [Pseudomassariella vexata]